MRNRHLDDITERIQRLERRGEQLEATLNTVIKGLSVWMAGLNESIAVMQEQTKTMNADVAELCQHVRGKMDI